MNTNVEKWSLTERNTYAQGLVDASIKITETMIDIISTVKSRAEKGNPISSDELTVLVHSKFDKTRTDLVTTGCQICSYKDEQEVLNLT